jgi:UDP-3-O-[3-hydroxymyristoyl] N-acetylglucosamine deacetylase
MHAARNQRTIAGPAAVCGIGYWSGREVRVEFRPAPPDAGITFVRADLDGRPRIPALVDNRVETPLRTTLCVGQAVVGMVEHVMAALGGLQIDNCEVWVDQPEMPGCDGSSLPFVEALQAAGIVAQGAVRPAFRVGQVLRLGDQHSWIEVRPCPVLQYELDYGVGNPIGRQTLEVALSPRHFHMNLAPSRTFLLESEALALRAQGLGPHVTCRDLLIFGRDGPIDNPLRFPDECVRHKLLDLVGDLTLAGCDLVGRFIAHRSGHRLNAELLRNLLGRQAIPQELRRCA